MADGSGLREIAGPGENIHSSVLSTDQKSVYVSATGKAPDSTENVWKLSVDGSKPEKLVDNCGMGFVSDADPSGQYLLFDVLYGEKIGIYEVCLANCYFPSHRACNNVSCLVLLNLLPLNSNRMLLILKAPRLQ
jgi:hypothetical protein